MQYRIHLSDKAEADVAFALGWFRDQHASEAGSRWFETMWTVLVTLKRNPERCSLAGEFEKSDLQIRELLFGRRRGGYRVLFQIEDDIVHILRIRHGARDRLGLEDL